MRFSGRGIPTCCEKLGCRTQRGLQRHHRRHEKLFIGQFAWRSAEPGYQRFVTRYWLFRRRDIVYLCAVHHLAIHEIYYRIMRRDWRRKKKGLYEYTWDEAHVLMDRLGTRCTKWIKEAA